MEEFREAVIKANEIREKSNKYWIGRAEERRQKRENSLRSLNQGRGFSSGDGSCGSAYVPSDAISYDEMYETLLITGELDLPGEWD
jgi:hypothetical protein